MDRDRRHAGALLSPWRFRGPEVRVAKVASVHRIAVIGDSFSRLDSHPGAPAHRLVADELMRVFGSTWLAGHRRDG